MAKKQLRGRPRKYITLQTTTGERTLSRRRVAQHCIGCGNEFSYIYPGTGPYRSLGPCCKPTDSWPYGTH